MDGYFVHLTASTLKLALFADTQPTKLVTEELLPTALSHSRIVDAHEFAKEFSRVLAQDLGGTLPKLPMYFVLEPELTELFLLTTSKNQSAEQFEQQIKDRLVDDQLADLYYGYFKIAPFIYQFVGIHKEVMQTLLDAATEIGLELAGLLPFGLILPKTNAHISSMFVLPHGDSTTVVFSELTGTTFAEKLDKKIALPELIELFWKLSVYNTKQTGLAMCTFAENAHVFGSHPIELIGNGTLEKGYEELALAKQTLEENTSLVTSQTNLLRLLPVPQLAPAPRVPAVAVASLAAVLLVGGLILQLTVGFNTIFGKPAPTQPDQTVLADQNQAPADAEQKVPTQPQAQLKRADIKLKVENGNGIPGSAGKLKSYLEGFGYTVVSAGNATKSDYTQTTVQLPKELSHYKDLLTNDLKTNYSVVITPVDTKPTDYDILIIAGLN
jgi:hypothetical protein